MDNNTNPTQDKTQAEPQRTFISIGGNVFKASVPRSQLTEQDLQETADLYGLGSVKKNEIGFGDIFAPLNPANMLPQNSPNPEQNGVNAVKGAISNSVAGPLYGGALSAAETFAQQVKGIAKDSIQPSIDSIKNPVLKAAANVGGDVLTDPNSYIASSPVKSIGSTAAKALVSPAEAFTTSKDVLKALLTGTKGKLQPIAEQLAKGVIDYKQEAMGEFKAALVKNNTNISTANLNELQNAFGDLPQKLVDRIAKKFSLSTDKTGSLLIDKLDVVKAQDIKNYVNSLGKGTSDIAQARSYVAEQLGTAIKDASLKVTNAYNTYSNKLESVIKPLENNLYSSESRLPTDAYLRSLVKPQAPTPQINALSAFEKWAKTNGATAREIKTIATAENIKRFLAHRVTWVAGGAIAYAAFKKMTGHNSINDGMQE